MEFIVRGARDFDEPGVFMAFEETERELIANVDSLGFALDALVEQQRVALDSVQIERNEIEETGDYDLEGIFVRLSSAIAEVGAAGSASAATRSRTASRAVPRLVVMVDLSGSIDPPLLERFAREIEAISRRLEAGLTVVAGDQRVSGVTAFEPGQSNLRELAFAGGGGTDFSPLLREAERHAPDIGVFLTDLDGPAEYKPSFPVIWAVPAIHADARQPFGRKLVLE
ncbi:MAG: VWA-like domain-containing protein, partial [Halochromatium sp.]